MIHVHVTPEVSAGDRASFANLGCHVKQIERFGDGRYCNKIAQLKHLRSVQFDVAVLLDSDTIIIHDIRRYLRGDAIQAKVVNAPNPSRSTLQEIARRARMPKLPAVIRTDACRGETFMANCNGGFYAIPKIFLPKIEREWPHWTHWLLENAKPLRGEGKEMHTDQVAMWLTIHMNDLPFAAAPSNLNYDVHFSGEHCYYLPHLPICMIHYHGRINAVGLIEPAFPLTAEATRAVEVANAQINGGFDNRMFWNFRGSTYI